MGIRNYLVKREVYIIKQNKKYSFSKVITDITNKKEPYKQMDKEINLALINIKLIITIASQD